MLPDLSTAMTGAISAVERACSLTLALQERLDLTSHLKGDRSPVTVADYAAQALIAHDLALVQPELALVAEEDAAQLDRSPGMLDAIVEALDGCLPNHSRKLVRQLLERPSHHPGQGFWTLDPIDGTKGFLRKANYAIALAWVEKGHPSFGVLGCPRLKLSRFEHPGVLVAAQRGKGAWARPLNVNQAWSQLLGGPCPTLAQARLLHSFEPSHTDLDKIAQLRTKLRLRAPSVGIDSQAKYAMLAAGDGNLLLRLLNEAQPDYRERIWDHAAGQVILEESGGIITDLCGHPLDFTQGRTLARNTGVLASCCRALHEHVLASLASLPARPV